MYHCMLDFLLSFLTVSGKFGTKIPVESVSAIVFAIYLLPLSSNITKF